MERQRAKEILSALAEGVNPLTGEILPADDSCNQAEVVRALYAALQALEQPAPRPKAGPVNAGKPWSQEEMDKLTEEFDMGMKIPEIAQAHGRTQGGIESKLAHMGKMEARQR